MRTPKTTQFDHLREASLARRQPSGSATKADCVRLASREFERVFDGILDRQTVYCRLCGERNKIDVDDVCRLCRVTPSALITADGTNHVWRADSEGKHDVAVVVNGELLMPCFRSFRLLDKKAKANPTKRTQKDGKAVKFRLTPKLLTLAGVDRQTLGRGTNAESFNSECISERLCDCFQRFRDARAERKALLREKRRLLFNNVKHAKIDKERSIALSRLHALRERLEMERETLTRSEKQDIRLSMREITSMYNLSA